MKNVKIQSEDLAQQCVDSLNQLPAKTIWYNSRAGSTWWNERPTHDPGDGASWFAKEVRPCAYYSFLDGSHWVVYSEYFEQSEQIISTILNQSQML